METGGWIELNPREAEVVISHALFGLDLCLLLWCKRSCEVSIIWFAGANHASAALKKKNEIQTRHSQSVFVADCYFIVNRDTQWLFFMKYLFGEANIA